MIQPELNVPASQASSSNRLLEKEQRLEKSLAEKISLLVVVVIPLLGTLYAITLLWQRYVNGLDLSLLLIFYVLSGLGITVGHHRLLTHRSFETYPVVKALLLAFGAMAMEGRPSDWASVHLEHHAHSDTDEDPHSPLVSLWHAHLGWMFRHVPRPQLYGPSLLKDPVAIFADRTWLIWAALGLVIPFAIGGWQGLIWGALVRICLTHHITWSVNSICHTFGTRPYQTRDASRNNWLVGLLAFGEGWHNNHHAFPRSAFHGLRWWEFDLSAGFISLLEWVGLAWNVQRVTPEVERRQSRASGL
jgi:stearoyl-CoA desaturase (delta-9 desaturase)